MREVAMVAMTAICGILLTACLQILMVTLAPHMPTAVPAYETTAIDPE